MKKKVRIVFGLMLLSFVFMTMSAFQGGCGGPEIPVTPYPEQGCYSNDDCGAGYVCDLGQTSEPVVPPKPAPVMPQEDGGSDDGDIATKKQNCMAPEPPGRCIAKQAGCKSDNDCRGGQICVKPAVRCAPINFPAGSDEPSVQGQTTRCGGVPVTGTCQDAPKPPKPPKTSCRSDKDCAGNWTCQFDTVPAPMPVDAGTTGGDDEPRMTPSDDDVDEPGMSPAGEPTRPNTRRNRKSHKRRKRRRRMKRRKRRPRVGVCQPPAKRHCQSARDCKSGETCLMTDSMPSTTCETDGDNPHCKEPAPAPAPAVGVCVPTEKPEPGRRCTTDSQCWDGEFCSKEGMTEPACPPNAKCMPPAPVEGVCTKKPSPTPPPAPCKEVVKADGTRCSVCEDGVASCSNAGTTTNP